MRKNWRRAMMAGAAFLVCSGLLAGCAAVDDTEETAVVEENEWLTLKCGTDPGDTLGGFERTQLVWQEEDVEILSLPESRLLQQAQNLLMLKAENGKFYSLGHGPSGDGSRELSMAVFGFDGTFQEELGPEGDLVADFHKSTEADVYHYFRHTAEGQQFVRADLPNFSQEVLVSWPEDEHVTPWSMYYAFDDRSLYYIKEQRLADYNGWQYNIYQHTFGKGERLLATGVDISRVLEIAVGSDDKAYILMEGMFLLVDDRQVRQVELDFAPRGREGSTLYYVDEENWFTAFDAERAANGDPDSRRRIGRVDAARFEATYYDFDFIHAGYCFFVDQWQRLLALNVFDGEVRLLGDADDASFWEIHWGKYSVLQPYGDERLYLWDTEADQLAFRYPLSSSLSFWSHDDRYLFCGGEQKLWIFDVEAHQLYETSLTEEFHNFEFFDGEYLYGIQYADWYNEDGETDTYYRVKVR